MLRGMRPKRVALALVVGVLAVLPVGQAKAAPFTPHLESLYRVAVDYWGQEPTNCTSLDRQIVDDGWLQTVYPNPHAGPARATEAKSPQPCILYVERSVASPDAVGEACAIMIHDFGHLLGYSHNNDPTDVMNGIALTMPTVCSRLVYLRTIRYYSSEVRRMSSRCSRIHKATVVRQDCFVALRAWREEHRRLRARLAALGAG